MLKKIILTFFFLLNFIEPLYASAKDEIINNLIKINASLYAKYLFSENKLIKIKKNQNHHSDNQQTNENDTVTSIDTSHVMGTPVTIE